MEGKQRTSQGRLRVAILGTPVEVGNRGVQALGTSLVGLCQRRVPGGEVFLMLGHRRPEKVAFRLSQGNLDVEVVNCRLSARARPSEHLAWILLASLMYRLIPLRRLRRALVRITPWIATLERAHLVGDVRGGDSFSDIYGMRRFLHGFALALSVILVKGQIVQFPQTFGPFSSPLSRALARYILKRSSVVMARDRESLDLARSLAGPKMKGVLCPDVAFSLEPIEPTQIQLEPAIDPGKVLPRFVGLNVNGLMYNGGYTRDNMFGLTLDYRGLLPKLVDSILRKWDGELWLVPHTYGPWEGVENDLDASRSVIEAISPFARSRLRLVVGDYDCSELKWIIGKCEFFIGSRMHSCIAALSQGIPCVGVAYSRKFKGVFETVGMDEWVIDGTSTTNDEALNRILELYAQRQQVRTILAHKAEVARHLVFRAFKDLFSPSTEGQEI